MPIIKAAIKHLRQSQKHRVVNRKMKDALKDALKNAKRLAGEKKAAELLQKLPEFYQLIDKAAKNNLIHANKAARKKSELARWSGGK